jgi:hypothetical protein
VEAALGDAETVAEAVDLGRLDALFGGECVTRLNPLGQPEPVAGRAAETGHDQPPTAPEGASAGSAVTWYDGCRGGW